MKVVALGLVGLLTLALTLSPTGWRKGGAAAYSCLARCFSMNAAGLLVESGDLNFGTA